jgi:RNA polymerase sigma-70 factor (ECF subfamily)
MMHCLYRALRCWAIGNLFSQLVEAYQSPIWRFFFNLTGDEELSKDLAQDTFLKAWLNIGSFHAAAKFSTWLYRIAYNIFYDHTRVRKPVVSVSTAIIGERRLPIRPTMI